MIENSEIRKVYSELQKQLFYLIPEKWDRIYLYASVEEKEEGLETGELFFYYFPRGILKKNPVNVYEIPNKFSLNEEEYIKLVEELYAQIKQIWEIFKKENHRLWTSVTVRIEDLKFEIGNNIKGNNGLTCYYVKFTPDTKINSGTRLVYGDRIKWADDFQNNYKSWYKSGRI